MRPDRIDRNPLVKSLKMRLTCARADRPDRPTDRPNRIRPLTPSKPRHRLPRPPTISPPIIATPPRRPLIAPDLPPFPRPPPPHPRYPFCSRPAPPTHPCRRPRRRLPRPVACTSFLRLFFRLAIPPQMPRSLGFFSVG